MQRLLWDFVFLYNSNCCEIYEAEYGTPKVHKRWGGCAVVNECHYEQEHTGAYQAHHGFMKNIR